MNKKIFLLATVCMLLVAGVSAQKTTSLTVTTKTPSIESFSFDGGVFTILNDAISVTYANTALNKSYSFANVTSMLFETTLNPPMVIAPGQTKTRSQYITANASDIIIESNDSQTGQLDLEGGTLTVNGVVKLVKTFARDKWYAVGFPFNIASVRCDISGSDDRDLETYKPEGIGNDKGDYWLQTYDGVLNKFEDYTSGSKTIAAGGYVLQIPDDFDGATFTFISGNNPMLSNSVFESIAVGEYKLVCNPFFTTKTITNADPDYFYAYENRVTNTNNFGLLAASETYDLKPFASVVIAKASGGPSRSSMNIETLTSLPGLDLKGDKVISTEYYNLQGVKIAQPSKGSIYLTKKIFESGKTSVVKQIK